MHREQRRVVAAEVRAVVQAVKATSAVCVCVGKRLGAHVQAVMRAGGVRCGRNQQRYVAPQVKPRAETSCRQPSRYCPPRWSRRVGDEECLAMNAGSVKSWANAHRRPPRVRLLVR